MKTAILTVIEEAKVTRKIVIKRLCADGEPIGRTVPKEVLSPDIEIENITISESQNEQTIDSHVDETHHSRTRKDTIKRKRTHDCTAFVRDEKGKILTAPLKTILEDKLFGAFRNSIPTYLNSADQGRQMSGLKIDIKVGKIGDVEKEPESQMIETNGISKGTIWRYAEVLSSIEAQVTFRSTFHKQKKLEEFVAKTLSQRIGKFHNKNQRIGNIEIVD